MSATVLTKKNCFHCGNPIEGEAVVSYIENEKKEYCCEGCKTVSEIIISSGNDYFYSLKGNQKTEKVTLESNYNSQNLDSEFIRKKYVKQLANGNDLVYLKITNIHCSACVWLNERALQSLEGVQKAQFNFASGRAQVEFEPNKVKLSQIFETILSIGYKPILYNPEGQISKTNNLKSLFFKMAIAGFSFGNIMLFSIALYAGYFSGIEADFKRLLHYASWALATPAYLYSGSPFMFGAIASIRRRILNMDLLLFIGISMAYFYSVYVTLSDKGEVYFDSVCMIYFFILIGKFFEEKARVKASEEIENLTCKLPEIVTVMENGIEREIPSEQVEKGMLLKVLVGNRIPVDAELWSETAFLDESILTGESRPVQKTKGSRIIAGSIVLENPIECLAINDYNNSSLANLKNRLENALLEKPKIQILTERIANRFIQVVFFLALLTFIGWMIWDGNLVKALINTIAVLIVACPCALGISVPTALVMNHITNSKKGILQKNSNSIEPLSKLDVLLFDKTGTLTHGKFQILENHLQSKEILPLIYKVEKESRHPIGVSLIQEFKEKQLVDEKELSEIQLLSHITHLGEGIEARLNWKGMERVLHIGNKKFISKVLNQTESIPDSDAYLKIHISLDFQYQGYLTLGDKIREESFKLIQILKKQIPEIAMLSGDSEKVVQNVARQLEISNYYFEHKPEDKQKLIENLQKQGKIVGIVGDGVNDSLSLAKANVGISHSKAEDISIDKADVVIVSDNLLNVYQVISNAKLTRRIIKQNIAISFMYNSVMLPLAMFGYMLPVLCAGFMTLSSITVLLNSLSTYLRSEEVC
ncbi:MAG: heavy metal translocating P-type ATPase [Leptospiraceae bacterium]|nr:heavy metal translocating P-type ATPase [Leptospiraceae bacterium]